MFFGPWVVCVIAVGMPWFVLLNRTMNRTFLIIIRPPLVHAYLVLERDNVEAGVYLQQDAGDGGQGRWQGEGGAQRGC